jgi:hypothetical protein
MIANRHQQGIGSSFAKGKNNPGSGKPNNYICTHCGETGHSKLRYYELIGYLEWWDFFEETGKAAMATSGASVPTQEETFVVTHFGSPYKRKGEKQKKSKCSSEKRMPERPENGQKLV